MQTTIINKGSAIDFDKNPDRIAWTEMVYGDRVIWTNKYGLAPEGEELEV